VILERKGETRPPDARRADGPVSSIASLKWAYLGGNSRTTWMSNEAYKMEGYCEAIDISTG